MKYKIFNEDCVATMQRMIRGGGIQKLILY